MGLLQTELSHCVDSLLPPSPTSCGLTSNGPPERVEHPKLGKTIKKVLRYKIREGRQKEGSSHIALTVIE